MKSHKTVFLWKLFANPQMCTSSSNFTSLVAVTTIPVVTAKKIDH